MEKLLVAENKSYEAYRTNSNKQALSETPLQMVCASLDSLMHR